MGAVQCSAFFPEVGDRLRISKEDGGPWTCVILKCLDGKW